MAYVKTNVIKSGTNPGGGGGIKDKVTVFDWADVTGGYARDSKGIVMPGTLVFGVGKYAIQIEVTQSTIKAGSEVTGEDDAEGINQSVEFNHPGDATAIREFMYNWLGRNAGIIIEKCSDGSKKMYGSPCAPLKINYKEELDKTNNRQVITFKSAQPGPAVANYEGTITLDTVKGTAAAAATSINVAAGSGEYQTTSGVAAAVIITTLLTPEHGAVYSILGSGGGFPSTIVAANDFTLQNGTTWTALAGAKLTVKAFKNGGATFTFVEQSRS